MPYYWPRYPGFGCRLVRLPDVPTSGFLNDKECQRAASWPKNHSIRRISFRATSWLKQGNYLFMTALPTAHKKALRAHSYPKGLRQMS